MTADYIAGYKWSATSDDAKYHACDAATAAENMHVGTRYKSRCGARHLMAVSHDGETRAFDSILHLTQCQRCALLEKDRGTAPDATTIIPRRTR